MFFKDDSEPMIKSKNSFYFGFVSGVAIIATLGLLVFGIQYLKKASPENSQNTDIANTDSSDKTPNQPTANQPTDNGTEDVKPVDVKILASDHIRGNKNAPITIVTFSDYQCPYCSNFHETMQQVMKNYPDKVRWVFKHFPLSFHPYAQKAAEAAECAGEQNKFWEYTDKIYANQDSLSDSYLLTVAKDLKLDTQKFNSCLNSGKYADKIKTDLNQGQGLGVRGTPGSFINGKSIPGAVPYSTIDEMIKAETNK